MDSKVELFKRIYAMDKMIIGVSGKKRSGKDTVANHLETKYGFTKMAFASPIKWAAEDIFGFNERQLYGDLKEVEDSLWGFTPRWAMQMIGTDLFRDHIAKDIWIRRLKQRIRESPHTRIVVSDVRFLNEVQAIKDMGGQVVKINRPSVEKDTVWWKKWLAQHIPYIHTLFGPQYHQSELNLEDYNEWDYELKNDKDLPTLFKRTDLLAEELGIQGFTE